MKGHPCSQSMNSRVKLNQKHLSSEKQLTIHETSMNGVRTRSHVSLSTTMGNADHKALGRRIPSIRNSKI